MSEFSERVRTAAFVDPSALRDWADEIEALIAERDDYKLALVDCLKSRSYELRRLQMIVEMAWKVVGDSQEWDCDCPVCAAIRTRTPHALEGGRR